MMPFIQMMTPTTRSVSKHSPVPGGRWMPSIREGARRLRSGRRCGIELLEDRRLLTFVFTSSDYVVPAGSPAAVIQVREMILPLAVPPGPNAEDHVELALYAEGAD